jgi:hypothetical protein
MEILAKCPSCGAALPVAAASGRAAIRCGRCGHEIQLDISEELRADRAVDRCPICRGADFYVRRDFNPQLGLAVVVTGAAISALFYWFERDLIAYAILGGAALIDLVVYTQLKDLTVCYRCHAEFRGVYQRTAPVFDLHVADELEREYERAIGRR